jgi:hypothetical protein
LSEWEYYSGKKQRHTLKYELAVHIETGDIVWMNGPFPGSMHDLTIARSGFVHQLLQNEQALGDKAYIGCDHFIAPCKPPRTPEQHRFNAILHRRRALIEQVNKRIKHYNVFRHDWRHDLSLHGIAFRVVVNIVAMCLMIQPIKKAAN